MRTLIAALLLAGSLAACSSPTDGPDPSPSPSGSTRPTAVRCADSAQPVAMMFYPVVMETFGELVTTWSRNYGRPYVDLEAARIYFLRDDGSAHTSLDFSASGRADKVSTRWHPNGAEQCPDAATWKGERADATAVDLEVGHCWIEPVDVGGSTWDVVAEDQWGSGAGRREGLSAHGHVAPAGDVLLYTDDEGATLTLVPEGHAWTVTRGGCA